MVGDGVVALFFSLAAKRPNHPDAAEGLGDPPVDLGALVGHRAVDRAHLPHPDQVDQHQWGDQGGSHQGHLPTEEKEHPHGEEHPNRGNTRGDQGHLHHPGHLVDVLRQAGDDPARFQPRKLRQRQPQKAVEQLLSQPEDHPGV